MLADTKHFGSLTNYFKELSMHFDPKRSGVFESSGQRSDAELRLLFESIKIVLSPDKAKQRCEIAHIANNNSKKRSNGLATFCLEVVTNIADKHGVELTLNAIPHDGSPLGHPELRQWYERRGFQYAGGPGKEMIREPQWISINKR